VPGRPLPFAFSYLDPRSPHVVPTRLSWLISSSEKMASCAA
jgi:hypothetical protein